MSLYFPAPARADELTVAVSVPSAAKPCGRSLPRMIADELKRFGVGSVAGKAVAAARKQRRTKASSPDAIASVGRQLEVDYVLHVSAKAAGAECRARAQLVEVSSARTLWSSETRFSVGSAEQPVRRLAGLAMLDLFGKQKAWAQKEAPAKKEEPEAPKVEKVIEEVEEVEERKLAVAPRQVVLPKDEVVESTSSSEELEAPSAAISGVERNTLHGESTGEAVMNNSMLAEPSTFEESSSLQLRGLLSVANALEQQAPLDAVDFKRRRAHAFATFRGMGSYELSDAVEVEAHALQALAIVTDDYSPYAAIYDKARFTANRFTGLEASWASGDNAAANISMDRLNVRFSLPSVDITVGRQPVNLATTYYFTPNDFFMPFSADTVYRGYKPGVDAGRVDVQLGELSTLSLLTVLGYERTAMAEPSVGDPVTLDRSAVLLMSSFSAGGFHLQGMAGKIPSALVLGGAIEGELGEWLGVRAEGHYASPSDTRAGRIELALGMEHRFENSLHLRLEYFFHGGGRTARAFGSAFDQGLGTIAYLSRNLTAFGVGYELTPMLKLDALAMMSLTDASGAASLVVTYSIFENGEVAASGRLPWGRAPETVLDPLGFVYPVAQSEFGSYPLGANIDFRIFF